jgi:hypothetical protein
MPRTAIAQIAKLIGQELESGAGPSEQALATGPMLAEAGAPPPKSSSGCSLRLSVSARMT